VRGSEHGQNPSEIQGMPYPSVRARGLQSTSCSLITNAGKLERIDAGDGPGDERDAEQL